MTTNPAPADSLTRLAAVREHIPTVVLFVASSLSSWSVDYVLVLALSTMTGSVLTSVVAARLVSSTMNFLVNRRLFATAGAGGDDGESSALWRAALGYATVQLAVMTGSYLLLSALSGAGVALWLAKILADSTLFVVNYLVQSRLVYRIDAVIAAVREMAAGRAPIAVAA